MCFTIVRYTCDHKGKHLLKCRKLWSTRTRWCCYPAYLFVFGRPTEEPCNEFVEKKAFLSSKLCPECTKAEEAGPQTRGIVPSKYRHRLSPEALKVSRKRMEEEKKEKTKERWYSRQEDFQAMLMKRLQQERVAGDDATANTDKPLPDMPSFVHVPLGDRWGEPSYHYPQHVADAYGSPTYPPPKEPIPSSPHEHQPQPPRVPERSVKHIGVVLKNQPAVSPDQHQYGVQHLVKLVDNSERRRYEAQYVMSPNPTTCQHFEREQVCGGRQVRDGQEVQQPQQQQSLHHQNRYTEARSLTDPSFAPELPIAERRGGRQPQPLTEERFQPREPRRRDTGPEPPVKTPKSGPLKGFFQALGSGPRCGDNTHWDRNPRQDITSDAHSDISSFMCRESRDVEKGRRT